MTHNANAHAMDGFDVWFFGGTPGPGESDHGCTLRESTRPSIDEDDARIPSFAHRCDCGKHVSALPSSRAAACVPSAKVSMLALHI
ncbi:MAG: hypothetical protein EOP36_15045 [Rubrivivax sp.]|nr:MAG: hypothetical protein EOP36_15045 [Rubrivivax sp.]